MSILVTGASGHLGRRVVELLLEQKIHGPIIATTRKPERIRDLHAKGVDVRQADFDDELGLLTAFRGAERALLVSTNNLDAPGRRGEQHKKAVRAFEKVGVRFIAYTSMLNPVTSPVLLAPDHMMTEQAIAGTKMDYALLRNSLYAELLLTALPTAVSAGQVVDARNNGMVSYVSREDCARVAASVLMERTANARRTLDVTGPQGVTSDLVASYAAEITGKQIKYLSVSPEKLVRLMGEQGLPRQVADLYVSFDVAVARGDFATVSDTVKRLTGRDPQSVRDFLAVHKAALLPQRRASA